MTRHKPVLGDDFDPDEPTCEVCGVHVDLLEVGWVHGGLDPEEMPHLEDEFCEGCRLIELEMDLQQAPDKGGEV